MPWYWTDDIAGALVSRQLIEPAQAAGWATPLVAIRRQESDLETVIEAMVDDDEIPLAA